jgi:hypothetical protein
MSLQTAAVLIVAAVVAVVSARPYAGSWNDGSRLATVESLVDRGTWAIDDSIFVRPNGPYSAGDSPAVEQGTLDKLLINGRFYSDKSPVPAVLMAGEYAVLKAITGWTAASRPARFCLAMCLLTSGLAYIWSIRSIDRLGRLLGLSNLVGLGLTASFALATLAPVYAEHVNNHILLLAVSAALLVELVQISRDAVPRRFWVAGFLAGLAYTIDLGAGPAITLGAAGLVVYRGRLAGSWRFFAGAAPCVLLHHALNYAIGGTFGPANAHVEYLMWPGSPFTTANATGGWTHPTVGHFIAYSLSLLVGHKGFLVHNLALFLAVPAAVVLVWRRVREVPEVLLAIGWGGLTWLVYAVGSTNSGGLCCSIRWFVPLLAPGYLVLAVLIRELPTRRRDFAALSLWGGAMAVVMWRRGPWMPRLVPFWWVFLAGGLLTWLIVRIRSARIQTHDTGSASARLADTCTPGQRRDSTVASSSTANRSVA